MIELHTESDPANAVRQRVEIAGDVVGYLVQREAGWWVALGQADAPLAGYASPRLHPTKLLALSHLLDCTGALSRIVRDTGAPHADA